MVSLNNGETAMTVQDYFEKIWLPEHGSDAQGESVSISCIPIFVLISRASDLYAKS